MTLPKNFQLRQPDLSIIIPAYCEEQRIGKTLDKLAEFLKQDEFFKRKYVEVLVVAADAPDRTHEIVSSKAKLFKDFHLLKPGSRVGKGRDVQYGMLRAKGKITVFMDADLATPLHHLQPFYEACESGADVVIGTRNLLTYRGNKLRGLFSYTGNMLFRLISGIRIEDTQCGFKMFNERAKDVCFSKLTILDWDFDIELIAIALANNLKLQTFRINDWQDMPFSTHTERPWDIAKRMVTSFVRITGHRVRGQYR